MKKLKIYDSIRLFGFVLVFLVLPIYGVFAQEQLSQKESCESRVEGWLQALCDKDFSECDSYISGDGYHFMLFQDKDNPVSDKIYELFTNFIVDSIESVKIVSIKENLNTGYTDYEIEVVRNKYQEIHVLEVNEKLLTELRDGYVSGVLSGDELAVEIQNYYIDLFKGCFRLSDDAVTLNLVLSEKAGVDGVVRVYNTKAFVDELIPEMYNNLEVFQSNIKAKVDTVLRQY